MSTRAVVCPTCRMPLPTNSDVCPTCEDGRSDAAARSDDAYNRSISWWMRVACVLAAVIAVVAVRATGRWPVASDYMLMLVVELASAGAIWAVLKWAYPRSRRALWRTALTPSFIVVALVFACRAAGMGAAPVAAALPPAPAPRITITATESLIPLVRMANECFTNFEAQAKAAGNETLMTNLPAMFTLRPATPASIKANRSRLKNLDARLLEYDSAIRKSASGLVAKVEGSDAPAQVKETVMSAVRQSGTDLVKRCRESVAHQRRLVQQTDSILVFIEARMKRLSPKTAQTSFTARADQAAFEKLVKQFDAFEEESTVLLRRIHQRTDQSKQQLLIALTQPRQ